MTEIQELIEKIQTLTLENNILIRQVNILVSSNQFLLDETRKSYKRENIYAGIVVALIFVTSVMITTWIVS